MDFARIEMNPDTLFVRILAELPTLCQQAEFADMRYDERCSRLAQAGFRMFQQQTVWSSEHQTSLSVRLQGDLSEAEMAWYEECSQAISAFCAITFGAMLGHYAVGSLDDAGFLLYDAQLAGFVSLNDKAICDSYQTWAKSLD